MRKRFLGQFKYLLTLGDNIDIYTDGCLRIGLDRNTGEQIMGYIVEERAW